ncbi:MAG: DUF4783 domain-containing protein [Chitinophagales bacterium]
MKNNFLKIIFSITFAIATLFANAQSVDQIGGYLQSGNAGELSKYFQSNVEINLKDGGNSYSKSQAEQVLSNFFSKHTPRSFAVAHQGTSPEGSKYIIGNLVTSAGNFRVYVYTKPAGGGVSIQEIRFEEQ